MDPAVPDPEAVPPLITILPAFPANVDEPAVILRVPPAVAPVADGPTMFATVAPVAASVKVPSGSSQVKLDVPVNAFAPSP